MQPQNPMVPEQARFQNLDPALRVSTRGQVYANARVMQGLDSTATPAARVVYDRLSETKVALLYVKKATPGAVRICRRKPEGPATFSFGPVLAFFPALKVEAGWIGRFPFQVERTAKGLRLVIDLKDVEVVPSSRRVGKQKDQAPIEGT